MNIHGKELGSILLPHGIKKCADLGSTRFRITLDDGFKELRIRMPDLPDTESAKKKLRIENVDGAPEDLNVKMLMP